MENEVLHFLKTTYIYIYKKKRKRDIITQDMISYNDTYDFYSHIKG